MEIIKTEQSKKGKNDKKSKIANVSVQSAMASVAKPFRHLGAYVALLISVPFLSFLSFLSLFPMSAFADHPKDDPFIQSLGVQFQDGQDAGDAVGSFVANLLWWGGLVVIALCIITAIGMVVHIMTMSKEDKEHHGTFMKWIMVIVAVVIAIALAGLLFSGLGKAAG
ncbi:hypothetical protein [Cysteiniphilum litorale]|uniref:hypothetical protein n=1 Tax=Cysteiniphilum litorale TaxID=2056700 RepID=UPI003F8810DD